MSTVERWSLRAVITLTLLVVWGKTRSSNLFVVLIFLVPIKIFRDNVDGARLDAVRQRATLLLTLLDISLMASEQGQLQFTLCIIQIQFRRFIVWFILNPFRVPGGSLIIGPLIQFCMALLSFVLIKTLFRGLLFCI